MKTIRFRYYFLIICMSCIITCYAQAAKNPFEKTHPIGADYFLKTDANRIEGIIKKGREKVKSACSEPDGQSADDDFKKAEGYFEQADKKIQNIRPGEKEELKQKKESLIQALKEARLLLAHSKDFVDVDALFRESKELEETAFTTHRSKFKDEAFQTFVLGQQYDSDEYKTGWVYLVIGNYESAIEHLAKVSSQNANYLRGVAQLEKAHKLKDESELGVAVLEYEAAEKIFSSEEFHEPVLNLVKNKWGIANAWRLWLTLEEKVFGENAQRGALIKYWEEIWSLVPGIGEELPALNSDFVSVASVLQLHDEAQTPLDIVAADEEKSGFKLGWFYSAIGWYEKALQHLDENAIAKIPPEDRFYAYYFCGKAKEAMYVPNAQKEQLSEFDQTQIEGAYRAYSEALKYAQSGQFASKIAGYMKRCCKAWGPLLIETPAQRQNAYLALEEYKAALRMCAENFYIQHQLMDFFRQDWSAYDKLGFSFHGPDGYYSIYFDERDKGNYENSIKLISLLQLFLSRDYVTVSADKWQSYYSFSPREAKLLGESIEASVREILDNEFLSRQIFSAPGSEFFSQAKSLSLRASSPEDWNQIMISLATASSFQLASSSRNSTLGSKTNIENRYGMQPEDASVELQNAFRILADKSKPFSYAEAWYRLARLYEEKGIWAKATECYIKSLSLLPTGETYEKLGALLSRLSKQNPNANFCMEQAKKLRLNRFPGR